MSVSPVLTAHPTEAQRRAVRRKHQNIAAALDRLDSVRLTAGSARELKRSFWRKEITLL